MKIKLKNSFYGLYGSRLSRFFTATIIVVAVALLGVITARAVTILSVAGFADFSYGSTVNANPTDGRPESKLWFHDGLWWGNLYNPEANEYQIYRLDWDSQDWVTTNVATDDREESRADVLWDETNSKLYVASHFKLENPSQVTGSTNWARLYRYSYDAGTQTYTLDAGYGSGITLNRDKTRTLVLDKDSTGRLWVTYVSKAIGSTDYKVYVNYTSTSNVDNAWGTAYALTFPEAIVNLNAISSVVAFTDDEGAKIGVAWTNEIANEYGNKFYFATRLDSADPTTGWQIEPGFTNAVLPYPANNHLNIAKSPTNQLFFAVKTMATEIGQPLIALVARDTDGSYYFHPVSTVGSNDTRPMVIYDAGTIDPGDEYVYIFTISNAAAGVACYVQAQVPAVLSDMSFTPANCSEEGGPTYAPRILADTTLYTLINNVTSTKQVLDDSTDIVVLASDDTQKTYVHAVLKTQFPYVTSVLPAPDSMVPTLNPTIRATFSQTMVGIDTSSFTLENSLGSVTGSVTYNNATKSADFVPDASLVVGEIYTATLTSAVTNSAGQPLLNTPYKWSFRTPAPPGAFDKTSPSNGATNVSLSPTLEWGSSIGATSYDYCIDTTAGNTCTTTWVENGTATSVALSNLNLNTIYYWHVRANNSHGTTYSNGGLTTAYWSFTTGDAPGAFVKTAPANGATGQPLNSTLSWGTSSGATTYDYCFGTDNPCTNWTLGLTTTSVDLNGLLPSTTYYWHVRANNAFGPTYSNGSMTAFWSFTTGSVPGAFVKTTPANGDTGLPVNPTLTWGSSSGATSYEYCYDTTPGDACTTSWVGNGTATSKGLSGLTLNTTYYWHVRALNAFGTTYSNGTDTAFWSFNTGNMPGTFSKTAPTNGAVGQPLNPTLSWGSSATASTYDYCFDTTNDNACTAWIGNGTATSVELSGLSLNTTYYWHVRANNTHGTTYSNGLPTSFWSFTTGNIPGAFEKIAPTDGATGQPLNPILTWGTSSGATSYEYCYATTNTCTDWASAGTNTSVNLSGLSPNTTYYWHVRAVNDFGSTYSNGSITALWSFTTVPTEEIIKIFLPLVVK